MHVKKIPGIQYKYLDCRALATKHESAKAFLDGSKTGAYMGCGATKSHHPDPATLYHACALIIHNTGCCVSE